MQRVASAELDGYESLTAKDSWEILKVTETERLNLVHL